MPDGLQGSWTQSLLFPCMICYFVSAATWGMLYSSEPVDFDAKMPRPATGAKLAAA